MNIATKTYPAGTRVEMIHMPDDPDPIPTGSLGTITGGSGTDLWVSWDSGRSLSLIMGVDTFRVVEESEERGGAT